MDSVLVANLVALLTTLWDGAGLYAICCTAIGARPSWRDCAVFIALTLLVEQGYVFFFSTDYSGITYLFCFILTLLQARFAFRKRGWSLAMAFGLSLLAQFGFVVVVAPASLWVFGDELANHIIISFDWDRLLQSVLNMLLGIPYIALLYGLRILIRKRGMPRLSDYLYLSRAFLLLGATFVCGFMLLNQFAAVVDVSRLHNISALMASIMLLVLVCLSYLLQDFRYLQMRRNNDTLARQKQITDTLLTGTRQFRHNALNLIYGFEGALLNESPEAAADYYRHLAHKCALINHENDAALRRLNQPQLEKLLLEKIQWANDRDIPCYVTVQGSFTGPAPFSNDIRQALDWMLDAAIESAAASQGCVHFLLCPRNGGLLLSALYDGALDSATARCRASAPGKKSLCLCVAQRGRYVQQTVMLPKRL